MGAQRIICLVWGITTLSFVKFAMGFTANKEKDPVPTEIFFRLNSIFAKNKYGYNTRFMSDFDLLLDSMLNERFIDESTMYYDKEQGLAGDFVEDDVKDLLKDKSDHGAHFKSL